MGTTRPERVTMSRVTLSNAVAMCVVLGPVALGCGRPRPDGVGFGYEPFAFTLSEAATATLGGAISEAETQTIKERSEVELRTALSGLPIRVTDKHDAFWTVTVRRSLPIRPSAKFPNAGETRALGAF